MSIRQQVEDATFLAENGRYNGALTNLMLAVAASARTCFPKGTKSLQKPNEAMGDREAFTLFLGGRIRKLLFGDYGGDEYGDSGISVGFKGQQYDIAYILYKFYRCELVHEGELPEDVEFNPQVAAIGTAANMKGDNLRVSISAGNKMVLDHGWIDLLTTAVVNARCNGAEFGIKHFDLVTKPSIDGPNFELVTITRYQITPGRFQILKHAVRLISPDVIDTADDEQLTIRFLELVNSGQINGGAITGLYGRGLTDRVGRLQPKGIVILREIAATHIRVET
jgi:hypothetical protein